VRTVILQHTISREEFHHKLQSGQIQAAILMISSDPTLLERGFTQELDVTTYSIAEEPDADRSVNNGYLRTKINLLTGEVQNEISHNLVLDSIAHTNLQQLHAERIDASYRIVRGHLDRLKAILTALSPALQQCQVAASDEANPQLASLGMGELTATLLQNRSHRSHSVSPAVPSVDAAPRQIDRLFPPEESIVESLNIDPIQVAPGEFDEIDLSLQTDDEVWEEWVEDDDFQPKSSIGSQPTTVTEELKLPALQEHWVRRPLSPIDVKPIVPRANAISSDPIERWEKFVPEYIEIEDRHRSSEGERGKGKGERGNSDPITL
jgi:hypothetical protein